MPHLLIREFACHCTSALFVCTDLCLSFHHDGYSTALLLYGSELVQLLVVVPALVAGLEADLGTDIRAEMLEKMPAQLSELNFNDFNFNFNEFPILSRLGEAVARLDLAGGARARWTTVQPCRCVVQAADRKENRSESWWR